MSLFSWMAWTQPVALFFAGLGVMLIGMAVWEWRSPTILRRGLLPLATTRGDRLFIGLLVAAYINLAWAGLTDATQWGGAAVGAAVLVLIMKWG